MRSEKQAAAQLATAQLEDCVRHAPSRMPKPNGFRVRTAIDIFHTKVCENSCTVAVWSLGCTQADFGRIHLPNRVSAVINNALTEMDKVC